MIQPKETFIYVYQTICEPNGKSYIGVHRTQNMNDGYIGCGVFKQSNVNNKNNIQFHNAVRKYGYASFRRYILSFYDTYEEALEEERYLVNKEWTNNEDNYNCAIGGRGNTLDWMTETQRLEHGLKYVGAKNHRYGKDAHNKRKIIQYSLTGKYIKTHNSTHEAASEIGQWQNNISNACRGKYIQCGGFIFRYETYTKEEQEGFDHFSSTRNNRIYKEDGSYNMSNGFKKKLFGRVSPMKGRPVSIETRMKQAEAAKNRLKRYHSEETKRKIGLANSKIRKQIEHK